MDPDVSHHFAELPIQACIYQFLSMLIRQMMQKQQFQQLFS